MATKAFTNSPYWFTGLVYVFLPLTTRQKNNKPAHMTMAKIKASRQMYMSILSALDKRCDFVDF